MTEHLNNFDDLADVPTSDEDAGGSTASGIDQDARDPLAVRRIRRFRAQNPKATPAQVAERLSRVFVRDFTLVGGAEAGASEFTPNAVGRLTRNPKIATATMAASHLGSAGQKIANVNQSARRGVGTAAQVGSAQAVKTYVHAIALLHGQQPATSDEAAAQILGADVHELLASLDAATAQAQAATAGGSNKVNVFGAVGVIAARNPKTFLLVKAGEQIARTGSAIATTARVRREFATRLMEQVKHNTGEFPAEFAPGLEAASDKDAPAYSTDAVAGGAQGIRDGASATGADYSPVVHTPENPDEASQLAAPQQVEAQPIAAPEPVTSDPDFDPKTATTTTAKGVRFAARAFMNASGRFKK